MFLSHTSLCLWCQTEGESRVVVTWTQPCMDRVKHRCRLQNAYGSWDGICLLLSSFAPFGSGQMLLKSRTEHFLSLCVSKQHAVALISGVTAVWPMHKDSDAKQLYSSVQETFRYHFHSVHRVHFLKLKVQTFSSSCQSTLWVIVALIHIYIMALDQC